MAEEKQEQGKKATPGMHSICSDLLSADCVIIALEKAMDMVSALCKPRGSKGSREWIMSIPAQPEHDPDLVIADALSKAKRFIKQGR